MHPHMSY
nr:Abutilon yellows virus methyltransferase gene [Acinetobacter sp. M131]